MVKLVKAKYRHLLLWLDKLSSVSFKLALKPTLHCLNIRRFIRNWLKPIPLSVSWQSSQNSLLKYSKENGGKKNFNLHLGVNLLQPLQNTMHQKDGLLLAHRTSGRQNLLICYRI